MSRARAIGIAVALLLALVPAAALAQGATSDGGQQFTLRINGDEHIAAGERVGSAVVIRGNAVVDGAVDDALVVIDGDAVVNGTINDAVIVNGTLTLAAGSTVRNVSAYRSDVVRDAGATVTGTIRERSDFELGWFPAVFGIFMWVGSTIALLAAGTLFAAIGGRQLRAASAEMTARPGASILAAVALFIGLPILAVIAIITLIGAPVGIGVLLFLLPFALFLGYLAFGTLIGALVLRTQHATGGHPYREALLGVGIAQVCGLVPLGGVALLFGAAWGAGALTLLGWRAAGRSRVAPASTPSPSPSPGG